MRSTAVVIQQSKLPTNLASQFELVSVQQNIRSTSGFVRDAEQRLLHYKRIADGAIAQNEAAELHRARLVTQSVIGISPVKVQAWCPDENLMVTEYASNTQTLFNRIWNGSVRFSLHRLRVPDGSDLVARLGNWLRVYHQSTISLAEDISPFASILVSQSQRKLTLLMEREPGFVSPGLERKLRVFLERIEGQSRAWRGQKISHIHGDFALANVLVNKDGKLFITDFGDTRVGCPWEDLVRVWHELWTISQLSPYRRRLLSPCLERLLESYGESHSMQNHSLFKLIRCWNAICNILTAVVSSRRIGLTAGWAALRLARVNRRWLMSIDWNTT